MPPLNMRGLVRGTRSRARTRDFGVVSEQEAPAPAAASKPASAPPAPAPKTAAAKADGRGGKVEDGKGGGKGGAVASGKRAVLVPRRNNSLWNEWSCQEVCSWASETLRKHGIAGESAIIEAFQAQEIKGSNLPMLSAALLHDELAFGALGPRLTFLQERDKLIALQATSAEADEKKGAKDGEAVQKISDLATSVSSLRQSVSLLTTRIEELAAKRGLGVHLGKTIPAATKNEHKEGHQQKGQEQSKKSQIMSMKEKQAVAAKKSVAAVKESHKKPVEEVDRTQKAETDEVQKRKEGVAAVKELHKKPRKEIDTTQKANTDEGQNQKARWTHFVSLPIENREVLRKIGLLQEELSSRSPSLKPGLISPRKMHASLAILSCADDAALERARLALAKCAPEFSALFAQGRAEFNIRGVGHFRNTVLWAGVEDSWKLRAVATIVQKRLRQAGPGVIVQGKDSYENEAELQGHVTLMKTSFFTPKQRSALSKHDKDLSAFAEGRETFDFGWETASLLQLCAMKTRMTGGVAGGGEGGYVVNGIVNLPPTFSRLPSVVSWNGTNPSWDSVQYSSGAQLADLIPCSCDSDALAVKVKISCEGSVVTVNIEVQEPSVSQKATAGLRVEEAGSGQQRDPASAAVKADECIRLDETSSDSVALRREIAHLIEAALLSSYSYQMEAGWSDAMDELKETEEEVQSQLAASGSATVTYAYTPSTPDTVMTVDIHMPSADTSNAANKTKQWGKLVEQGWKAAKEASEDLRYERVLM